VLVAVSRIKRENVGAGNSFTVLNAVGLPNCYAGAAANGDLSKGFLDLATHAAHQLTN